MRKLVPFGIAPIFVLLVLAAVALFAMTATPNVDLGGDDGALTVSDLSPANAVDAVSVSVAPDEAHAAWPWWTTPSYQCFAAGVLRSISAPFFTSYWNFIQSRVC